MKMNLDLFRSLIKDRTPANIRLYIRTIRRYERASFISSDKDALVTASGAKRTTENKGTVLLLKNS